MNLRVAFGMIAAVVRRPDLWATAVRQLRVLAAPGWWRRPPFLPVPDRDYLRFRLVTAYGGDGSAVDASAHGVGADAIAYLEWCRAAPLVA